jgi:hypothetical protein
MTYPDNDLLAKLVHACYFGMTATFVVLTIIILVRAAYQRRITKNKLTLNPYYYMIGYFSFIILKNWVLLSRNDKGEFPGLLMAWTYIFMDYLKTLSVLMAFGSQSYEWFLLSRMVAY